MYVAEKLNRNFTI